MSRNWLIGNLPPPVGGQSLITSLVAENLSFSMKVNTSYTGKRSLLKLLYYLIVIKFLHNSNDVLYIVPSRGRISIWRELLFFFLWNGHVVAHMHGNDYHWILRRGPYNSLIRGLLQRNVTKMICVNDTQKHDFQKLGVNSCVVRNPVLIDIGDVSPSDQREFDFGFISVIMASKGIFDSLDLFEDILQKRRVRMIVAGSFRGDDEMSEDIVRRKFFERVEAINIRRSDSVIYIGEVHGDDVVRFYNSTRFLLFQSRFRSESFGLVLIEALSMGVVPIISDNRTLSNTLSGFFYLKESDDIDSFLNRDLSVETSNNRVKVLDEYSKDLFLYNITKEIYANSNHG